MGRVAGQKPSGTRARSAPVSEHSRFVPIARRDLLPRLMKEREDGAALARAADRLHHLLRHEANERAERLQAAYAPFDPDPLVPNPTDGDPEAFLEALAEVLDEANFRRVTDEELRAAFAEKSLFPLRVEVDVDEYDVLRLYRRGMSHRDEKVRGWSTLWRWRTRRLALFVRLVVALRLKPEALRTSKAARTQGMEPGLIYLKSFKNIPTADVEMVLPNTRLRMRHLDRILVGGPLVAGVGWTLFQSVSVLLALATGAFALTLDDARLQAVGGVLLVLTGYLWRTHSKVKTTRLEYLQTLSQGLYFRNLANNRTVIDQTLRLALDEEEKEALLAYHLLSRDGAMSTEELDRRAEAWILEQTGRHADFDVHDGIARLEELGLVENGDAWRAVPCDEATRRLGARWDAAFAAH